MVLSFSLVFSLVYSRLSYPVVYRDLQKSATFNLQRDKQGGNPIAVDATLFSVWRSPVLPSQVGAVFDCPRLS